MQYVKWLLYGSIPPPTCRIVFINPYNGNNFYKYAHETNSEEEKLKINKININQVKKLNNFVDNTVRNTKYTIWNVIFLLVGEQFSLHMNQYFLLLAVSLMFIVT
jgi:hypothetical protein